MAKRYPWSNSPGFKDPPWAKPKEDEKEDKKKPEPSPAAIKTTKTTNKQEPKLEEPAVFREKETDRLQGVKLPDGRTFFGLTPTQTRAMTEAYVGGRETPPGAVEMSDVVAQRQQQQELEQRQQEILPVAEETGVFEERPERVELDVTEEERKGTAGFVEKMIFGISSPKEFAQVIFGKDKKGQETEREPYIIDDLIQNPETLRAKMLQEIQREELDKSATTSQKLGSLLEPIVGDLKVFDVDIGGYADKFVRMPMQEAEEVVEQIREVEGIVSGMTDSASQGEIGNPAAVLRDIAEKEEQIYRLEARLKRLILASEELRANPEKVNIMEEQILKTKETMFEAKQRAAEGALITPTDNQLYLKLQELRNE